MLSPPNNLIIVSHLLFEDHLLFKGVLKKVVGGWHDKHRSKVSRIANPCDAIIIHIKEGNEACIPNIGDECLAGAVVFSLTVVEVPIE
jgi:hypothetical protein